MLKFNFSLISFYSFLAITHIYAAYAAPDSAKVYSTCSKKGSFAQTFDDGPYDFNSIITSYLAKNGNIKATFFVNGNNYDCIYDEKYVKILQNLRKSGHQIASHTWNHNDITKLSNSQFKQQIQLLEQALFKIVGLVPSFFRPPYGSYNSNSLKILKQLNYTVYLWNVDSGDAGGKSLTYSKNQYYKALNGKYPKPYLGLAHETIQTTAKSLVPYILQLAKRNNYKQMTVGDCMGVSKSGWYKKYLPDSQFGKTWGVRDNTWTCANGPQPSGN